MSRRPFSVVATKAFQVDTDAATVIVTPAGDLEDFWYRDVHCDVGRIHDLLSRPDFENVVIDLQWKLASGMVLVDAMTALCRAARKRAAHCRVSESMAARLADLRLQGLWPVFSSVEEALADFRSGGLVAGDHPAPCSSADGR